MAPVHILIVGCGVAGPTLATFLLLVDLPAAQKPHVTILERSSTQRAHLCGQNIDIRGAGVTIIRKLGLEKLIRAATTGEEGVQLVDEYNRVWSSNPADKSGELQTPTSDIEILRGRLAEICWKNSQRVSAEVEREGGKGIEYIFGDYLDELEQDGKKCMYDLRRIRKMAWGDETEKDRLKRLEMYAGFFSMPRGETDNNWRRWFHAPGRLGIMLRPDGNGARTTVFMYVITEKDKRLIEVATNGHEGVKAQKALLEEYFRDAGWECARIIREMHATDDFYYDLVAQVKMDTWSTGRVVLLGDAGYCASPISGMGTTLAFAGAYNLAGSLRRHLEDDTLGPSVAFAEYEEKMRPIVENAQHLPPGQPQLMNPETAWGVWTMRVLIKMLSMTRVIFVAVKFFGKLLHLGPQAANTVPVEDYGFKDIPEWNGEDADGET